MICLYKFKEWIIFYGLLMCSVYGELEDYTIAFIKNEYDSIS